MPLILDIIRGQANHVMKCLGVGHTESVYHKALITAMNKAGVQHRSEVTCPFMFMGECVGMGRADMVIDDVVLEIKANKLPPKCTSPQLQKYLTSLSQAENKHYKGMVVNFNQKKGGIEILCEDQKQIGTFLKHEHMQSVAFKEKAMSPFKKSLEKSKKKWMKAPPIFKKFTVSRGAKIYFETP